MAKPIRKVKKNERKPKWEDAVEWVDFLDGKSHMLRLVGLATVSGRHWVNTKTGKFFPVWSTKFNPDSEEMDLPNPDPMYDDFGRWPQKVMIINVIDRNLQKKGNPNPVRGAILPDTIQETLLEISNLIDADLADTEHGVDLSIRFNPQGSGTNKWVVASGRTTPLQPHEDPSSDECDYAYYNFDDLYPDFTDAEVAAEYAKEVKKSMARNLYYVKRADDVELDPDDNPWDAYKGDPTGQPYTTVAELEEWPKPGDRNKKKKGGGSSKKKSENYYEEDESENTSRKTKSKKRETSDDSDAEEEEEYTPPKSNKKKAEPKSDDDNQVHPDIANIDHPDHGVVPECYTQYDGTPKCKKCPVRSDCLQNMPDDDEDEL